MYRFLAHLRRTAQGAWTNDVLGQAKGAAYSAILSFFPALIVMTAIISYAPDEATLMGTISAAFIRILPPGTAPLLISFMQPGSGRPLRLILSSVLATLLTASGVMTSFMESFRRAYNLPLNSWSGWKRAAIAFALVPLSIIPLAMASFALIFGHQIGQWFTLNSGHTLHSWVTVLQTVLRWIVAMLTSIAVLTIIYHVGVPRTQSWRCVVPGAVLSTAIWFPATVLFGLYVTRYANYSVVYGSLGAGIALLIWLYIINISIMIGAEFNAQVYPKTVDEPDLRSTRAEYDPVAERRS
ncbi:MAG TPA: YihY/virulence factor BrkB family protein [Acidobacteriaceae bacterium]|nr:YihY/virulence factor BrkB family protein [Acidobacteriaceae bacterium]